MRPWDSPALANNRFDFPSTLFKESGMPGYQQRVSEIIANAQAYHRSYYDVKTFGGPSLYFHRKALENRSAMDFTRRLEYIYAALTAWGMHRMGSGGSKMLSFDAFRESTGPLAGTIEELKKVEPREMCEENWSKVAEVFNGITIMESGTTIVGNSKVMAHLLPNLVPPIDREYTLRHLRGTTNIRNGKEREWLLMKEILSEFFFPVWSNGKFRAVAAGWVADQTNFPWDTSILKVIDNLIIGARRMTN
jgi:hypothetical protein